MSTMKIRNEVMSFEIVAYRVGEQAGTVLPS